MSELFDRFIHDWPLPDAPISDSFVVLGCSHTTGVGLDPKDAYPSLLARHYNLPLYNLAIGNGNADVCQLNVFNFTRNNPKPKFVIIQWPNPIRQLIWNSKVENISEMLENINNSGEYFKTQLKYQRSQFYFNWTMRVMSVNRLLDAWQIPRINIYLDTADTEIETTLKEFHIHCDEKIPGKTWFFDSAAADGMHHSAWCHEQWAKRLIPLIDEATTR